MRQCVWKEGSGRFEEGRFREAGSRIISGYFLEKTKNVLSLQWLCSFVHMEIFVIKFLINFPALPRRKGIQGRGEDAE